jgi:hypothetical protein
MNEVHAMKKSFYLAQGRITILTPNTSLSQSNHRFNFFFYCIYNQSTNRKVTGSIPDVVTEYSN